MTASTLLNADRCSMRSVTWPELCNSFATRSTAAGEVDMASAASSSAGTTGTAYQSAMKKTAIKQPSASITLVTPSQGFARTQRRLMR